MLRKKGIWLSFVIVLSFALLMGCSSGTQEGSTPANGGTEQNADGTKPVELIVWTFGTTGYEELAKEYSQLNPHVTFKEFTTGTDYGDHHNSLFTAMSAGGGAPDIAMVEVGQYGRFFSAQDHFYNLADFGAVELESRYLEWKWKQATNADGSFIFGLPTDIGPTVMYYRTDVFEQAGLPTDPKEVSAQINTWEKFREAARQVKEKTGKPMLEGWEMVYNARRDQASQTYFNEQEELIIENNPEIRQAYDYTVQLIQDGVVASYGAWTPEWGAAMNNGDFAVLLSPAWMKGVIMSNAPDAAGKWAIADMPEGAGNWGGSFLTIPKQSKNAEEAYKFIAWLTLPENQLRSFKEYGLFPAIPELYVKEEFVNEVVDPDYFVGNVTNEVYTRAAERVVPKYLGIYFSTVQDEILDALRNVLLNQSDSDREWKEAIDRVKSQLGR